LEILRRQTEIIIHHLIFSILVTFSGTFEPSAFDLFYQKYQSRRDQHQKSSLREKSQSSDQRKKRNKFSANRRLNDVER
jgi:hypothetical protein